MGGADDRGGEALLVIPALKSITTYTEQQDYTYVRST